MSSWQIFQAILHSVGFYWKKFIVLSVVVVAISAGVYYWRKDNTSQAAFSFADVPQYQTQTQKNVSIIVKENGQVLVDGKDLSSSLKLFSDHNEIRIVLIDNPGIFIENLIAKVTLPRAFSKGEIEQITYAVHGVGSYRNYVLNDRVLVYEASNITAASTLTIVTKFPKNMIKPIWTKRISYLISTVPAQSYLIFAVTLPLLTLGITLFMVLKRRKDQIISLNAEPSGQLPAQISPAVVGVLIDGQVGSREMAATLIDLAQRKFIYIIKKGNGFTFGKRKSVNIDESPELKTFEKILLSKIFTDQAYKSTREDVEMRVGHHIFSRKMAQVFLMVYDAATDARYFIKNPANVHRRWRYTGIALFFLSLLGFVQSAVYDPDPKFTLLFWVGSILAASVIIKISGLMPARSKEGSRALGPWMAFRKYLKLKEPMPRDPHSTSIFAQSLSYAIVFGVEDAWAKRFLRENFTKPDWYESNENADTLEDFIGGLYPLISFMGDILAGSHEPTVE